MDTETPHLSAWVTKTHDEVVRDLQSSNIVAIAAESSKQTMAILAGMQSPLVNALANINPMLPMLNSIQESMQQWVNPIRQMAESVTKIVSAFNTVPTIVKIYREMIEQIRAQFQRFVESINLGLLEAARKVAEVVLVPFYLYRYHILKRARDGDEEALLLLSTVFNQEYRSYCSIHKLRLGSQITRLEFAGSVYGVISRTLAVTKLNQDALLSSLFTLFRRLFYALRDWLRKTARKLQQELANEKSPEECVVQRNGQQYFLLPTLSIFTRISEATLRRYCSRGKIKAVKFNYISPKTRNKNISWHVPYTPNVITEIKSLSHSNNHGKLSRKQISEITGIHIDTLRSWERKGLINVEKVNRHIFYLENQINELRQLFQTNNSPRYRHLLAKTA